MSHTMGYSEYSYRVITSSAHVSSSYYFVLNVNTNTKMYGRSRVVSSESQRRRGAS
jgi:hypothetical protein